MCVSRGGGGGDGGAAEREAARQANIQAGYDKIKSIFEGTKAGTGNVDAYTAGSTYYDANGNPVVYSDGMDTTATPLFSGTTTTGGFGDDFYNQRATDYVNYAEPQLDDQYSAAVKKLTFALAQAGRLNSSTRGTQFADLQKQYDLAKTGIVQKGQDYANQARSAVDSARANLVSLNASLADPSQIANQAQSQVAALQAAPSYSSLSPLFTNVGEDIATQADLERRNQNRYSTGIFNTGTSGGGSARYIN